MGHSEFAALDQVETVIDLALKHVELKAQLSKMQQELDLVNQKLVEQLEHPIDGSKTHKVESMKVKVTGRMNRSLDRDVWSQIKDNFNPALRPVKDALDESAWKKLQRENPEVAARIAPAIKESPGKPGVEISF